MDLLGVQRKAHRWGWLQGSCAKLSGPLHTRHWCQQRYTLLL